MTSVWSDENVCTEIVAMVVPTCEHTKTQRIIHCKFMNCMANDLQLNKAVYSK
jgi:hypothetical protein